MDKLLSNIADLNGRGGFLLGLFSKTKRCRNKFHVTSFIILSTLVILAAAIFAQWHSYDPERAFAEFALIREDETGKGQNPKPLTPVGNEDSFKLPLSVNIVFLGLDRTELVERFSRQEISDKVHPDTIIFATLNIRERQIKAISIPRDARVPIINQGINDKINAAYNYGYLYGDGTDEKTRAEEGIRYTLETIENLVGVAADFYVAIDMDDLIRIVDLVGGVYYDVEQNIRADLGQGRVLVEKGYQLLDGEHFLYYIQYRDVYGRQQDRMDRQQRILKSAFKQFRDGGKLFQIPLVLNILGDSIDTNLSSGHIGALLRFAGELDMDAIKFYNFEGEGIFTEYGYYFYIDEEQRASLLEELLGVKVESMGIVKGVPINLEQDNQENNDDFDLEEFKKEFWQNGPGMLEQN